MNFKHSTKVKVKLRQTPSREGWYLFIEAYPYYKEGETKPSRYYRSCERVIYTPIFDRNRPTRGHNNGAPSFKVKRNDNGEILCRTQADREACKYAAMICAKLQHEFDMKPFRNAEDEKAIAQAKRDKEDFIAYFKRTAVEYHKNDSQSIQTNWRRLGELLTMFTNGKPIPMESINVRLIENFKQFLLNEAPQGGFKRAKISQNTASTYFSVFKAGLHQAFREDYLTVDVAAKVKGIQEKESRREHLTIEELNRLAATPCDMPVLKRAALFSALTGLRHSDIQKLKWQEVVQVGEKWRLDFTQKKTGGVEYMPISDQAYLLCGERRDSDLQVFDGLPSASWISNPLKRWVTAAGITKHITFHCFRHTYATIQLTKGTDIFTVSKMLGHTKVQTTQVYAKVVDEKKIKASEAIRIDLSNL